MPIRTLSLATSTLFTSWIAMVPSQTSAQSEDYSVSSRTWNGLASLLDLAAQAGVPLVTDAELNLNRLSANDGVLVIYPTEDLPIRDLSAFMTAGGRLAIADDFGTGDELLSFYGIERVPSNGGEIVLRGNDRLLIAEADPRLPHVLTEGVTALVTNHPAVVRHDALTPLLAFQGDSRGALLAGRIGAGRLIVLSDPSVLINNMLELDDNRRFAINLLHYLHSARGGRVHVITKDARIVGSFGGSNPNTTNQVRQRLAAFASADAPPLALRLSAVVLAAILLAVAMTSLPRRSPYDASAMLPSPAHEHALRKKDPFFREPAQERFEVVLAYRFEFERALLARIDLPEGALLRDVVAALRARGASEPTLDVMRAFLLELETLEQQRDLPKGTTRLSEGRFHSMIDRGERILAAVSRETEHS